MSRFNQRLRKDLRDPEFSEAFYEMSVGIALMQVLEQARKALNASEKELAERMRVQRPASQILRFAQNDIPDVSR